MSSGISFLKFEFWCCVTLSQLMGLPEPSPERVVGREKQSNTDGLAQHLAHSKCSISVCCCCPHQQDPPTGRLSLFSYLEVQVKEWGLAWCTWRVDGS